MRRTRIRQDDDSVSLFPFLAVLICTMGSLIVLLVLVMQQARVYAATVAEQEQGADAAAIEVQRAQQERDEYLWRQEVLEQQRTQITQQLSNQRLELSHLEDHIYRLEQQWKQLQAEARALQASGGTQEADIESQQARLRQILETIEQTKQQLQQAEAEAARRKQAFAIIPYEGPNGTKRRPIYIECTGDAVILRPENIALTASDFEGPLGPGNPLDAALRAIREYYFQNGQIQQHGEPYPLLLVRPDGAYSYSTARSAMSTWDDEFGYELIDADMTLDFPLPDLALADLLQKRIEDARRRQAILAAAMPSRFPGDGGLTASRHGGFTPRRPLGDDLEGFGEVGGGGFGGQAGGFGEHTPGHASGGSNSEPQVTQTAPGNRPNHSAAGSPAAPNQAGPAAGGNPDNGSPGGAHGQPSSQAGGAPSSLANKRGVNWALPNVAAGATGITRPIHIVCDANQLTLLPERGDNAPLQSVIVDGSLAGEIDGFVSLIWKRVESWGIAVVGGYWKPVIHCNVTARGEARFAELQTLLENSGLEVRRQ